MKLSLISSNYNGYQQLINFYQSNKDCFFGDIHLDLSGWFSADMSAVLGALLDKLTNEMNTIHFDNISSDIEKILLKNDFLTRYGRERLPDINNTTIIFQKIEPNDGKFFSQYVFHKLLGRTEFPSISYCVRRKIAENIYEIFNNAQTHSETEYIYTCGQFYPKKNEIRFIIADTGIGFKESINRRFNANIDATKAISWAIENRKTTRKDIPGGLGLALLKEFIEKNKGQMQIISDSGFYQFSTGGVIEKQFNGKYPGAVVSLMFRTDDMHEYKLKSE